MHTKIHGQTHASSKGGSHATDEVAPKASRVSSIDLKGAPCLSVKTDFDHKIKNKKNYWCDPTDDPNAYRKCITKKKLSKALLDSPTMWVIHKLLGENKCYLPLHAACLVCYRTRRGVESVSWCR